MKLKNYVNIKCEQLLTSIDKNRIDTFINNILFQINLIFNSESKEHGKKYKELFRKDILYEIIEIILGSQNTSSSSSNSELEQAIIKAIIN